MSDPTRPESKQGPADPIFVQVGTMYPEMITGFREAMEVPADRTIEPNLLLFPAGEYAAAEGIGEALRLHINLAISYLGYTGERVTTYFAGHEFMGESGQPEERPVLAFAYTAGIAPDGWKVITTALTGLNRHDLAEAEADPSSSRGPHIHLAIEPVPIPKT